MSLRTRGSGGDPPATTAPRLRRQPWTDPRLLLGLLLVLGSTVLGASVVEAADDTRGYWALARDVAPGDPVREDDLVESRARVPDEAADSLLPTDDALPGRTESLRWGRAVPAGALVDRASLVAEGAVGAAELPLSVALGAAPDDLRGGERVDVWVGPSPEDATGGASDARLVLSGVTVVGTGSVRGAGGARTVLVDVAEEDLDGDTVAALTARHVTIVRRS
jgi:hypothetical protein